MEKVVLIRVLDDSGSNSEAREEASRLRGRCEVIVQYEIRSVCSRPDSKDGGEGTSPKCQLSEQFLNLRGVCPTSQVEFCWEYRC